jgi:hypothetical protein
LQAFFERPKIKRLVDFQSNRFEISSVTKLPSSSLAMSGPEQKRTAPEQKRIERRSKSGFVGMMLGSDWC